MKLYQIVMPSPVAHVMVSFGSENRQVLDVLQRQQFCSSAYRFEGDSQVTNFAALSSLSDVFACVLGDGLVFSARFYEHTRDVLAADMDFFPCRIDGMVDGYLASVKRTAPLIDPGRSRYRTLTDGRAVLMTPAYLSVNLPGYCYRDEDHSSVVVVTEQFVQLLQQHSLLVDVKPLDSEQAPSRFW